MNLCKKCSLKSYSFLVIDAMFVSDNPLCLRKIVIERIWKIIMIVDDKITDEKLQYDINR